MAAKSRSSTEISLHRGHPALLKRFCPFIPLNCCVTLHLFLSLSESQNPTERKIIDHGALRGPSSPNCGFQPVW